MEYYSQISLIHSGLYNMSDNILLRICRSIKANFEIRKYFNKDRTVRDSDNDTRTKDNSSSINRYFRTKDNSCRGNRYNSTGGKDHRYFPEHYVFKHLCFDHAYRYPLKRTSINYAFYLNKLSAVKITQQFLKLEQCCFTTQYADRMANSADPDQTASPGPVWSASTLFTYEPRHEKTCLRDLRQGMTQTGLLSYRD